MNKAQEQRLLDELLFLYGNADALPELLDLVREYGLEPKQTTTPAKDRLSQQDIVLITYGDQVKSKQEPPLKTLHHFLNKHVRESISVIHFLPFYPYSSDDGFSVIDYKAINPKLGSWQDIKALRKDYRLMFDAVINHISVSSSWFKGFLEDKEPFKGYFISLEKDTDLSSIVRPRTSPLLTKFDTAAEEKYVWTTFSADQVDLNYANPKLLLEIVKIMLYYAKQGADIIRLDAITYLWKEIGSSGVHHPKTHAVLRLLRAVLEIAGTGTVLISETNVPHSENISYFGNGFNEAQMVYNFALPPLTLYSFLKEDASALANWAKTLKTPSDESSFFNFLASHDGVGLRPVEKIIGQEGIDFLSKKVLERNGFISYKENSDGSKSPYELNINYFDALSGPNEKMEIQIKRFVCAHSIMFSLAGVAAIYFHSLFGSRGDPKAVIKSGKKRSVNREKFLQEDLEKELSNPQSRRSLVLTKLKKLIEIRKNHAAFHPQAGQEILASQAEVLVIKRFLGGETIYCLHNLSLRPQEILINAEKLRNLFTGQIVDSGNIKLEPLTAVWLKEERKQAIKIG